MKVPPERMALKQPNCRPENTADRERERFQNPTGSDSGGEKIQKKWNSKVRCKNIV